MANKRSYEEFEPFCKWRREEQEDILEVHLQGFKKDQLRVQIKSTAALTISGERPLDETRSTRFIKTMEISKENYKLNEIHAKFSGGILYITIPKKIPSTTTQNQSELAQKNQENVNAKQQIDQDKEPKGFGAKESGAWDKIPAVGNAIASTSKPTAGGPELKYSVPGLKMGRQTAMKVGALAAVVVVMTIGAYLAYKYYQSFNEVEDNSSLLNISTKPHPGSFNSLN